MQKWHIPQNKSQTLAVLLFDGFSNLCLANAVEPLRVANTLAGRRLYDWQFVTLDGAGVASSSGLPVTPAGRLRDHLGGAFLFLLPGYAARSHVAASRAGLRAAQARFETLVGMDTGSWLLAAAGLLDGRCATIHRDELTALAEAFPTVSVREDRWTRDGPMVTCGGALATFDLVLDLIAARHGEALRLEIASFLMSPTLHPPAPGLRPEGQGLVPAAVALMGQHLEDPLSIPELAERLEVHPKTLARACQAELGAAPLTVYRRLRLTAARRLAEQSTYDMAEIALRCGYASAAAMTRAFVAEFGLPPSGLRRG